MSFCIADPAKSSHIDIRPKVIKGRVSKHLFFLLPHFSVAVDCFPYDILMKDQGDCLPIL